MHAAITHDEPHNEFPADTTFTDGGAPTQTATPTDTDVATDAFMATATDTATNAAGPHAPYGQGGAPWIALSLVAVVTLVVASLMWLSELSRQPTSTNPVVPDAVADTAVDSIEARPRLAGQDYVPREVTNREQAITAVLVGRALVPDGRVDDPKLRDVQDRGLVPSGTTVDEDEALRVLRTRGLVPSGRFDDAALRELQSRGLLPTTRAIG